MSTLAKLLATLTAILVILTAILLGHGYSAGILTLIASLLTGGGATAEAARR
jgi:hypothetical protein